MLAGEAQVASVKTIGRVATVLQALADGAAAGMRLSDLCAATGFSKATMHRLIGALTEIDYVEYDEASRLYRLGYVLFALGGAARRFHIVDLARPALMRLAAYTGDTVYLSLRNGDDALCVDRCTGSFPIRTLTLDIGDRRPLGIGAGSLALLAFQPQADIARVVATGREARRDFAGFGVDALSQMIETTRHAGYALNDGGIVRAMVAIGVPVRDKAGRVLAAMSIAAIKERFEGPRLMELVEVLQKEATSLGDILDNHNHPTGHPTVHTDGHINGHPASEKTPEVQT